MMRPCHTMAHTETQAIITLSLLFGTCKRDEIPVLKILRSTLNKETQALPRTFRIFGNVFSSSSSSSSSPPQRRAFDRGWLRGWVSWELNAFICTRSFYSWSGVLVWFHSVQQAHPIPNQTIDFTFLLGEGARSWQTCKSSLFSALPYLAIILDYLGDVSTRVFWLWKASDWSRTAPILVVNNPIPYISKVFAVCRLVLDFDIQFAAFVLSTTYPWYYYNLRCDVWLGSYFRLLYL